LAFPDFLQRGTSREQLCAAFFTESRMQFDGTTKPHRKSGFGLHQLRNRCIRRKTDSMSQASALAFFERMLPDQFQSELYLA
jgi:hypothetical protein